jgi:plastocyanin
MFTFRTIRYCLLSAVVTFTALHLTGQTSHTVTVSSIQFSPNEITISAGDTVIWKNTGGSHNVNGTKTAYPSNQESFGNNVSGSNWTYKYVFNTAGTYNYHCDPHVAMGMVGKVIVNPKTSSGPFVLTVNFTGMNPHVGQTLWLAVIDQATKKEIGRVKKTATAAFSAEISGIEVGKSYNVDFYADHNKNGGYNAPPTDHTWRLQANNVTGNTTLNFAHNTTFTDIAWKNKLTLNFTSMTPHVGQKLSLYLKNAATGTYVDTIVVAQIAGAAFSLNSWKVVQGNSYHIDFYADHNKNGSYNAPPTDHAWRIMLNNLKSDTIINFVHNTTFTDIFNVTSVPNISKKVDLFKLYPNPSANYAFLEIPEAISVKNVRVYSIAGTLVEERLVLNNLEAMKFDVSRYKNGMYFFEVNHNSGKEVIRFIRSR